MPRNDEVVSVSVYKIVDCFVIANEAKRSAQSIILTQKGILQWNREFKGKI